MRRLTGHVETKACSNAISRPAKLKLERWKNNKVVLLFCGYFLEDLIALIPVTVLCDRDFFALASPPVIF